MSGKEEDRRKDRNREVKVNILPIFKRLLPELLNVGLSSFCPYSCLSVNVSISSVGSPSIQPPGLYYQQHGAAFVMKSDLSVQTQKVI